MKAALIILGSALLALPACTSVDDPFLRASAAGAAAPSLSGPTETVQTAQAVQARAALPGRSPTDVREARVADGTEQVILYSNATDLAGENSLTVTFAKAGAATAKPPTRAVIAREMRDAVQGVAMRMSPDIRDNAYGVFGYATGELGRGGACLYAWQTIRRLPDGAAAGASLFASATSARVRLRYCDPAASAESLAALMQGLRIGGSGAVPQAVGVAPAQMAEVEPVIVNDAPPSSRRVRPVRLAAAPATPVTQPTGKAATPDAATKAPAVAVPLPGGGAPAGRSAAKAPSSPVAAEAPAESAASAAPPLPRATVKIPLPGA